MNNNDRIFGEGSTIMKLSGFVWLVRLAKLRDRMLLLLAIFRRIVPHMCLHYILSESQRGG